MRSGPEEKKDNPSHSSLFIWFRDGSTSGGRYSGFCTIVLRDYVPLLLTPVPLTSLTSLGLDPRSPGPPSEVFQDRKEREETGRVGVEGPG